MNYYVLICQKFGPEYGNHPVVASSLNEAIEQFKTKRGFNYVGKNLFSAYGNYYNVVDAVKYAKENGRFFTEETEEEFIERVKRHHARVFNLDSVVA